MTPGKLFPLSTALAALAVQGCSSPDGDREFTYAVTVVDSAAATPVDTVILDGLERRGIRLVFPDYADAVGTSYGLAVSRAGVTASSDIAIDLECSGLSIGHVTGEVRTLVFDEALQISSLFSGIACSGTDGYVDNYDDQ